MRAVFLALPLCLAAASAQGRELCGEQFDTMLQLRALIARDYPVNRDDPQWKSFSDKEHYRIWYLSKMRDVRPLVPNSYDAAVCKEFSNRQGVIYSEIHIVCVGSDASCDKISDVWNAWEKQKSAAIRADLAHKQASPPP